MLCQWSIHCVVLEFFSPYSACDSVCIALCAIKWWYFYNVGIRLCNVATTSTFSPRARRRVVSIGSACAFYEATESGFSFCLDFVHCRITDRHQFNGLYSSTIWVSRQQKDNVKAFRVLMKREMTGGSGISWTIIMQVVCTSLQTDNHSSISSLSFLQAACWSSCPDAIQQSLQCQSTKGYVIESLGLLVFACFVVLTCFIPVGPTKLTEERPTSIYYSVST